MKPSPNQPFAINWRHALLLLTVFGSLAFVLAMQPIAQDQAYHDFADRGQFLGIPNFFAVISNIPFLLVGIAGLRYCRSSLLLSDRLAWVIFSRAWRSSARGLPGITSTRTTTRWSGTGCP